MFLAGTLPVTRHQFKFLSLFLPTPISLVVDKTTKSEFFKISQLPKNVNHRLKVAFILAYAVFILPNGLFQSSNSRRDLNGTAWTLLCSMTVPTGVFMLLSSWLQYPPDFAALLNMFLVYEENYGRRNRQPENWTRLRHIVKCCVATFGFGCSLVVPISLIVMILTEVGMPPFLGSVMPWGKGKHFHVPH
ncbi:hypothetical protein Fcan01_11789 [Folsomia candida]|uniref:Uncharacterized protein n=1 Tax=Folsomia candida TaxID=158441 RepID=A0A226EA35_FOLCA|nr:hypothetical protein Fcan01_11789 [Folsomia candida]